MRVEQIAERGVRAPRAPRAETAPAVRLRRMSGRAAGWGAALLVLLAILLQVIGSMALVPPGSGSRAESFHALAGDSKLAPRPPQLTAHAAYLLDADSGIPYYALNADEQLPMASTTKIMTALLAVEHGGLDKSVTVGADAAALVQPDNSYMGLSTGEQLTLRELLYGLLLPSGNDAAVAIADAVGGSEAKFVAMMNARAQALGLTHTHYANPHGLGAPGHYTTARDLTILAEVAMRQPDLVKITSTFHYTIAATATHKAFDLFNGDDLIPGARDPYPGMIGVKIGYTGEAGYCQAFAVKRRGHLLIGVVLRAPGWRERDADMRALLNWAYGQQHMPAAPAAAPYTFPSPNL
ncbi:MAG TPA: serine hydrolase [Ktedonobacterales bacterium]|jgi:D-alanyl-D-alanine carboxypeptidase (penicillin-binding protein 5/6)|nr:serine hydrolase [Ktedonobacterales bacterium]